MPLDLGRGCIDRRNTDSMTERESALFFRSAVRRTQQQQRFRRKTIWLLFMSTHVEVSSWISSFVVCDACLGRRYFTCDIYIGHIYSAAVLVLSCAPTASRGCSLRHIPLTSSSAFLHVLSCTKGVGRQPFYTSPPRHYVHSKDEVEPVISNSLHTWPKVRLI